MRDLDLKLPADVAKAIVDAAGKVAAAADNLGGLAGLKAELLRATWLDGLGLGAIIGAAAVFVVVLLFGRRS